MDIEMDTEYINFLCLDSNLQREMEVGDNYFTKLTLLMKLTLCARSPSFSLDRFAEILGKRSDEINSQTTDGLSVLMMACIWFDNFSSAEVVKLLLEAGADPNLRDKRGETALMYICQNDIPCDIKIFEILVDAGADYHAKSKSGCTVLMNACRCGADEVVKRLIELGVDVNVQTYSGYTAIKEACLFRRNEIIEMLLDVKCDLSLKSDNGDIALSLYMNFDVNVFKPNLETLQKLIFYSNNFIEAPAPKPTVVPLTDISQH